MIQITDNIWIGTTTEALDKNLMQARHLTFGAILSCTTVIPSAAQGLAGVICGRVDVPDYTLWSEQQKQYAANFIAQCSADREVFVHSDLGEGRCAEAIYFYLVRAKGMSSDEAEAFIQSNAPETKLRPLVLSGEAPAGVIERKAAPDEVAAQPAEILTEVPLGIEQPTPLDPDSVELSVISVTWNRFGMVKEALQALLDSTPPEAEIIYLDNGSTDGTAEYLQEHLDRVKVVCLGRNYGKGTAGNIGLKMAKGRWICYLDSDVKVPSGWFPTIRNAYEKIPKAGWLSLPYENIVHRLDEDQSYTTIFTSQITGGMMFLSRPVLDALGGLMHDRLYGFLDVEYAERARERGYKVGYVLTEKYIEHLGTQDSGEYKAWKEIQRHNPADQVPEPLNLPPVEVIIVRFNLPEMEAQCIESVMRSTRWAYRLHVVDNYEAKEPLGILWNRLIDASPFDHILLLNSDCVVTDGWLTRLMETMGTDPQIAVVGPSTNACGTVQRIAAGLAPAEADAYALKVQDEYRGQHMEAEVSGFCYLLRKDAWGQVGRFSPKFGFYGQETELNIRLRYAGFKTVWRKDSFVYHHWGASVKAAAEQGELNVAQERLLGGAILQQIRSKVG